MINTATARQILEIARTEIGVKETPSGSNLTKYGTAYGWNGVPWCAIFVWWCFHQAGANKLLPTKTASCWQLMSEGKKRGLWVTKDYRPGDILIYDFPGGSVTDHTGICESVEGNFVTAIEGNTGVGNDANGGMVMRRTRKLVYVKGAVRPMYAVEKPLPLIAQEVLDGKYGNGDERRERLKVAGYDPNAVQKLVNALSGKGIRAQITADVLNVRQGPGTGYNKLDIFGAGLVVRIEEVRPGNGASAWGRTGDGWISLDYVMEV